MPAIKVSNQATSTNALNGLKFAIPLRAFLLSLWISAVTVTDTVSMSFGTRQVLVDANPNLEISADVVDIDRDQVLFNERSNAQELFLEVTATTAVNFLLVYDMV